MVFTQPPILAGNRLIKWKCEKRVYTPSDTPIEREYTPLCVEVAHIFPVLTSIGC